MTSALQGIRVLDFTSLEMGAVASMWLGDFGAEVIKVEKLGVGDLTRKQVVPANMTQSIPLLGEDSPTFMSFNRNKRSIAMDLKHAEAREIIFKLAQNSDVVVSNFRPGVMDELGFGYDAFKNLNPRVIYCTASGFGKSGPHKYKKGQDLIAQAMGGLMSMTGDRDGPPVAAGSYIADYMGGLLAAMAIMAALNARHVTGKGQEVDTSLLDGVLVMQPAEATAYLNTGIDWERGSRGTAHGPGSATYATYKTRDIYIVVVGSVAIVCDVLGIPNLEKDPRFDTPQKQRDRQEEVHQILENTFLTKPGGEWVELFEKKDIWAGPVNTYRDLFADPQVEHNGMIMEIDHPKAGKFKTVGVPVRLSDTPPGLHRPPPLLGQHTDEVLRELGYTHAQVKKLRETKVVG